MSSAHYILQVNIYLLVFYGFYKLLLDKETYFTLNRFYLLAAGILSLTIPFLRFEWFSTQPIARPVYITVGQVSDYVSQVAVIQDDASILTIGNMLVLLYTLGVAFFVVRLIVRLILVNLLLKKNESGLAFSFFRRKVVDTALPGFQTINSHEEIHIRQLHSLDVIFFEILGIIAWFNPVIYFYKHTVKNIHEYLADEEAASFQGDKEQYALLLLSSAFGVTPSNLTNSFFNKSLIKKRIYMLHKKRSKKAAILKYGLFLPLFAITLVMSSATIRTNKTIKLLVEDIPLNEPLAVVTNIVTAATNTETISKPIPEKTSINTSVLAKISTVAEKNALSDLTDLLTHLKRSLRYPEAAFAAKTQGFTMVTFKITNGEPDGLNIAGIPLGSGCDTELMSKILTYKNFSTVPDGKYAVKVKFTLSGAATSFKNENLKLPTGYTALPELVIRGYLPRPSMAKNDPSDNRVYDFVSLETQPTFPGGMEKFYSYLKASVVYPAEAKANNIEGKVFLSFIVEKDGNLTDIKVDRKLGYGTDEEAVRVMNACPEWVPGIQNGNLVRVKYNIPISFSLEHNTNLAVQSSEKSSSTSTNNIGPLQSDPVYDFVSLEQQPAFKGGMKNFYTYLAKTVKYPAEAQRLNKQGKVFLSFIVEKDGSLTDIKVDRKAGYGLDEEAVRVLKASPKWEPGIQQGKKVRVKYNIPISFTLTK